MLTVGKLRQLGMEDPRWTAQDKTAQFQGLINLYERDKKQQTQEATKTKTRQKNEIRELRKEVDSMRHTLTNAMYGDKQKMRNVLQGHRAMQLAYQELPPHKVIEEISQANFIKIKELDRLTYQSKLRMEQLKNLRLEMCDLQYSIDLDERNRIPRQKEQVVRAQIQNIALKQNAADTVTQTYEKILTILKKDSLNFDNVLRTLKHDHSVQSRCLIRAIQTGQMATEQHAGLKDEYKLLEKKVKFNMRDRDKAVKSMRKVVQNLFHECKLLTRTESEENLLGEDKLMTDADQDLNKELESLENILTEVQTVTLVPTFHDIFPRMQDQLRQQNRLLCQKEQNEHLRNDLLKAKEHGELMLSLQMHTMADSVFQYNEDKKELLTKIDVEKARLEKYNDELQKQGELLVALRCSLQTLYNMLQFVRDESESSEDDDTSSSSSTSLTQPSTTVHENAKELLKVITRKLTILATEVPQDPDKATAEKARVMFQKMISDTLSHGEFSDGDVYDFPLVADHEGLDPTVKTRADIKLDSQKLIEQHEKPIK